MMLHYATELKTIKEQQKIKVIVNDKPILFVYVDEQVYAIANKCPHLGALLDKGTVDGHLVTCKAHGATFDVKTGDVIEKPRVLWIKVPCKQAKTYHVEVKNQKVYVEFPDQI